jgi:hypothetical protein
LNTDSNNDSNPELGPAPYQAEISEYTGEDGGSVVLMVGLFFVASSRSFDDSFHEKQTD